MSKKNITGWLIVDWKSGSHRTRKSKPAASEIGANELTAKLDIDVTVPEVETPTLPLSIDVPEPQVHAAELSGLDADQLPDWTAVADEIINTRSNEFDAAEDVATMRGLVHEIVAKVMLDAPGRPDPNAVEEYVHEQLTDDAEENQ